MFTAFAIYLITTALNKGDEPNAASGLYAEELKSLGAKYQKCLERADSELDSSVKDPMDGTSLSRENIAQTDRDTCSRQYENQKRILKNRYE